MINDMPLPARKLVEITDRETGVVVQVKQGKRRNKYYGLSQLMDSEPETYKTIRKVEATLQA